MPADPAGPSHRSMRQYLSPAARDHRFRPLGLSAARCSCREPGLKWVAPRDINIQRQRFWLFDRYREHFVAVVAAMKQRRAEAACAS